MDNGRNKFFWNEGVVEIRESKALRSVLLKLQGLFTCYSLSLVYELRRGVEKGDHLFSVRYPSHLAVQSLTEEGPQNVLTK